MHNFNPHDVLCEVARSEFDDFLIVTMKGSDVAIISTLEEEELLFHIGSILERNRRANLTTQEKEISYEA